MFASSAIYRRAILQEKMEIENFLDVYIIMLHKLILQNLTFNLCMDKNFKVFTDLNHSDLGMCTGYLVARRRALWLYSASLHKEQDQYGRFRMGTLSAQKVEKHFILILIYLLFGGT